MSKEINGYILTRDWFDFAFENCSKVTANHTSLYLWLVEINNRLGWCSEFQITGRECMQGMSCKSYNTYIKCLRDLIDFGFVELKRKSANQYQTNIIALSKNNNPQYKALDKALIKHYTNQSESTIQGTDSIHKPQTDTVNHKLSGEKHFESVKEIYFRPYEEHNTIFQTDHTKTEYDNFQKFLKAMFREFEMKELTSNFDKCLGIGDWKRHLHGKGFMIIKPALEKAIAAKEGSRENMALRIKTFSNGIFDDKVLVR